MAMKDEMSLLLHGPVGYLEIFLLVAM
jgi:hypothetical protein